MELWCVSQHAVHLCVITTLQVTLCSGYYLTGSQRLSVAQGQAVWRWKEHLLYSAAWPKRCLTRKPEREKHHEILSFVHSFQTEGFWCSLKKYWKKPLRNKADPWLWDTWGVTGLGVEGALSLALCCRQNAVSSLVLVDWMEETELLWNDGTKKSCFMFY